MKHHYIFKPSKALIASAAVAGLLTGSFAVRTYGASGRRERKCTDAKAKTSVKVRAVIRPATTVAKAKTLARAEDVWPEDL